MANSKSYNDYIQKNSWWWDDDWWKSIKQSENEI